MSLSNPAMSDTIRLQQDAAAKKAAREKASEIKKLTDSIASLQSTISSLDSVEDAQEIAQLQSKITEKKTKLDALNVESSSSLAPVQESDGSSAVATSVVTNEVVASSADSSSGAPAAVVVTDSSTDPSGASTASVDQALVVDAAAPTTNETSGGDTSAATNGTATVESEGEETDDEEPPVNHAADLAKLEDAMCRLANAKSLYEGISDPELKTQKLAEVEATSQELQAQINAKKALISGLAASSAPVDGSAVVAVDGDATAASAPAPADGAVVVAVDADPSGSPVDLNQYVLKSDVAEIFASLAEVLHKRVDSDMQKIFKALALPADNDGSFGFPEAAPTDVVVSAVGLDSTLTVNDNVTA